MGSSYRPEYWGSFFPFSWVIYLLGGYIVFVFPVFIIEMDIEANPRGKWAPCSQAACSVPGVWTGSEGVSSWPRCKEDCARTQVLVVTPQRRALASTTNATTIRCLKWWLYLAYFFFEFYFILFLYSRFLLVIYFIHISVYMSIPVSQFIPPLAPTLLSPLGVHTFVLYICVSISALQTGSSIPFFEIAHVLIYDICFSLSDLIHSVWQSLDSSTSQQITQFRSFLWLSNIPLYICTTTSLSIHLLMDT